MSLLKVVFIMPSLVGGGAERTLLNVLGGLDRSRFLPRLFLQKRCGAFLDQVPVDVPVFFGSEPPGRILQQLPLFFRELTRSLRDADLVVGYLELTPGYLAVGSGALRGCPALAMVHINLDSYLKEVAWWHGWASRILYPRVRGMVFCSEAGREAFRRVVPLSPDKLHVVHNPLDLGRVHREAAEPWSGVPAGIPGRKFILGVGRLEPQKGFDLLIRAFAQVRAAGADLDLVILGAGPDLEALQSLASGLGIAGQVFFPGFSANPYPYFRAARQFVLSSRFEGMPTVVLEAMTLGVPTVCFDGKSGVRELFRGGRQPGLLVPAEDVDALAQAMVRMEGDQALRERCIEDGRLVASGFDLPQAIRDWEIILETACARVSVTGPTPHLSGNSSHPQPQ